mmetsp:Transcript_22448/g.62794  ORF Transcript_22448/g.62794 Transcript_22448/m.62794 type:complete len:383 (+) Transcript_22448:279-1427(+)
MRRLLPRADDLVRPAATVHPARHPPPAKVELPVFGRSVVDVPAMVRATEQIPFIRDASTLPHWKAVGRRTVQQVVRASAALRVVRQGEAYRLWHVCKAQNRCVGIFPRPLLLLPPLADDLVWASSIVLAACHTTASEVEVSFPRLRAMDVPTVIGTTVQVPVSASSPPPHGQFVGGGAMDQLVRTGASLRIPGQRDVDRLGHIREHFNPRIRFLPSPVLCLLPLACQLVRRPAVVDAAGDPTTLVPEVAILHHLPMHVPTLVLTAEKIPLCVPSQLPHWKIIGCAIEVKIVTASTSPRVGGQGYVDCLRQARKTKNVGIGVFPFTFFRLLPPTNDLVRWLAVVNAAGHPTALVVEVHTLRRLAVHVPTMVLAAEEVPLCAPS